MKRGIKLIALLLIISLLPIFLYTQNNSIQITSITIASDRLPDEFEGYRILHLSDLHNKRFGSNQKSIVEKIIKINPDIILVTGDTVDSRRYDEQPCIELFKQITDIAPVYLVTGNHEARRSEQFESFENRLEDTGVTVLRNEGKWIEINNSSIALLGVDDPDMQGANLLETELRQLSADYDDQYKILLSHRPELIDVYAANNIDLVFSGHAHGGQIRLPFVGGLVAPNQGWLPKYTSGAYREKNTTMLVSRGLGNSIVPQRILNRPELVVVTLAKNER
jgi:predicted MPP superfamily phosphohydrolase